MQEQHQVRQLLIIVSGLSLALPSLSACAEATDYAADASCAADCMAGTPGCAVCAAEEEVDPVYSVNSDDPVEAARELASIRDGVASFDPPRNMTRGEAENVRLIIGADQSVEDTENLAEDGGAPVSLTIDLGLWVCAELFASNFELQSEKVQCHNFGRGRFKSFDWDIVPLREGSQSLQVEVISYDRKGGDIVDSIPSRAIDVTVDVRLPDQIDDGSKVISAIFGSMRNMLLSLAGLIAALGVVVWRIRRIGKKPDSSE